MMNTVNKMQPHVGSKKIKQPRSLPIPPFPIPGFSNVRIQHRLHCTEWPTTVLISIAMVRRERRFLQVPVATA